VVAYSSTSAYTGSSTIDASSIPKSCDTNIPPSNKIGDESTFWNPPPSSHDNPVGRGELGSRSFLYRTEQSKAMVRRIVSTRTDVKCGVFGD
jgi:hypothetical protein